MNEPKVADTPIDPRSLGTIRHKIRRGDIVLFTGAGFSCDAIATNGQPIPTSSELRSALWSIAFSNEPEDSTSSLGDVYDCAVAQSASTASDVLKGCLTVDDNQLPDHYETWLSIPWVRAFTLNVDDLAMAAARKFSLPRDPIAVSKTDPVPARADGLLWIHLNGQLRDLPDVTFSAPQYAQRVPGSDPWYPAIAGDLATKTVIFVGTILDESPLWNHIELRGSRVGRRELRPKSFLVTPTLPLARREMLKRFNIEHIAMDAKTFANTVLAQLTEDAVEGQKQLSRRTHRSAGPLAIPSIAQLRSGGVPVNLQRYLLGREPVVSDLVDGYAIERSFEDELLQQAESADTRVTLLTGTAATGKSTALFRVGLRLDAGGASVGWLDPKEIESTIPAIRSAVIKSEYDYVIIDDVDIFSAQSGPLLAQLSSTPDCAKIIAASRSTRAEEFGIGSTLAPSGVATVVAPGLTDDDIDELIGALRSAGLLGDLAGKTLDEQRHAFRIRAGRQLLVAMIEVTSGRNFGEKIGDECSQLPTEQRLPYGVCALATLYRTGLSLDDLFSACDAAGPVIAQAIDALKRQYLLVEDSNGLLRVRHRVVARQVVEWLRNEGHFGTIVEGLLFSMAAQYLSVRTQASRGFRLLVRLINHKFMIEELDGPSDVRQIYQVLGSLLQDDHHFWLQRGSYELEVGDLDLAENYLNQARGLAGTDYRVRAAWSYMSLRRAAEMAQAGDGGWAMRASEAMEELIDVIGSHGDRDSYAFHILGSQGLHYVRRAPLGESEALRTLDNLRSTVRRGIQLHPDAEELKQLSRDLEEEYLNLAVVAHESSPA